jgi:hypothetical protein
MIIQFITESRRSRVILKKDAGTIFLQTQQNGYPQKGVVSTAIRWPRPHMRLRPPCPDACD